MREPTEIRNNRTGTAISPLMAEEMRKDAQELSPTERCVGLPLDTVRGTYVALAEPSGTMPPPAGLKEMAKAALQAIQGKNAAVLLDALGGRLAFERTGIRLYEALLTKARTFGRGGGGPGEAELLAICNDELRHFQIVKDAIERLGGDPTAVTPCADLEGVESMGAIQVITDPRMGLRQSLHAALLVELSDNEGWATLIRLAQAFGQTDLVESFSSCLAAEQLHLAHVRSWVQVMTEMVAGTDPTYAPTASAE